VGIDKARGNKTAGQIYNLGPGRNPRVFTNLQNFTAF